MHVQLKKIIEGPLIKNDHILIDILTELDQRQDLFFFIADIGARETKYVNKRFEEMLGYGCDEFISEGPDILFKIADKNVLPHIIEKQAAFAGQVKVPGFDPRSVIILDFPSSKLRSKSGRIVELHCLCIVLTYTSNTDFSMGISAFVENNDESLNAVSGLLKQFKIRHNQIYRHPAIEMSNDPLNLLYITSTRYELQVTRREMEILELLSKGLSTKEISNNLKISPHTAESHRRNLLEKFNARNSPELIKKASKIFWFE